jgi:hypothetical protein
MAYAPQDAEAIRTEAVWRSAFGLPDPSPDLSRAISAMGRAILTAAPSDEMPSFDSVLIAASTDRSDESQLDVLVWQVLRAMFEECRTRNPAIGSIPSGAGLRHRP